MGPISSWRDLPRETMKLLALLFLAAVVLAEPEAKPEAEADPGYYGYGYRGFNGGWGGYFGGYYGYPYGYPLWKRDAEGGAEEPAEGPKADPQVLYTNDYTHGFYSPYYYSPYYIYGYPKHEAEAAAPKKPEAEADPQLGRR